ncbi:MAG TPA: OmpA family protein [Bryobacteraceae bacterium]|nr:OmpA family protein [Bryobacteraceae bacterium]
MRYLVSGLVGLVLVSGAQAQWGYTPYPSYYAPYAPPQPVVVVNQSPRVVIREVPRPRQIAYLIAFKDSVIRLADAYWVSGTTLYYVTPDHQQKTAPLDSVDRTLSERLNREQNVRFDLPPQAGKAELCRLLQRQLNSILETRTTPCGLVVGISDVLFGVDQYTLTPGAREKLSKIAGILLAYGGLSPRLQGYTDNAGGDAYNLQLSKRRAEAVRDYLISQGIPAADVTAVGLGKANPVASNATAAGRQQNRRVEMLLSGDVIGIAVVSPPLRGDPK